jgi:hypothetical protein
MMPVHIVYLSHGSRKYHDQTRFSVLTLLHLLLEQQRDDVRIVVYTDDAGEVPQHPLIQAVVLSRAELAGYRGPFDYVHRIKLSVLRRASAELPGPLLYVDCDTRWLHLPDAIFDGLRGGQGQAPQCCMHVAEGAFSEAFFPDYYHFVQHKPGQLQRLGVTDTSRLLMWNAGAIGLPAGSTAFFDDVLRVSDYLFTRVVPRNWVEQFALSLVACSRYQMVALDTALHHYWNYSYEAPLYLARFFDSQPAGLTVPQLAAACASHDWREDELKRLQAASEHKRQRRRNKLRNSLQKRRIDLKIAIARLGLRLRGQLD